MESNKAKLSENEKSGRLSAANNVDQMTSIYSENAFNFKAMAEFLPQKVFEALRKTIEKGEPFPEEYMEEAAQGMKNWAISKGATHFTHWFQPMTGLTAEKHEAFMHPTSDGGAILKFSASKLVSGEPDASSFPSGGLRATFEARGYTIWDPTSPAFIKYIGTAPTLCIPTAFFSYNGEALDKKTPLLRSNEALSNSIRKLVKLFEGKIVDGKAMTTLGPEQEYFLIDRKYYLARPDLIQTGRTLFGKRSSKHQQMEDHYFGAIKTRIIAFMEDVDKECWKLGIPAKTRHNEVAPAQFEIVPLFEELNLSVDHNMMLMQILRETAEKHGLVCLLHEKPFAKINGSGKHNNWSIHGPDGKNLLDPGHSPHENALFLTTVCAVVSAVDRHSKILRAAIATAGNDHRLGANEAPPAIISISLGDHLTEILSQIEKGANGNGKAKEIIRLGVTSLPQMPKDTTDRNRTSPFAFTGNKFEFRAIGSSQSCAGANMVLNTIVAEALDEISDKLEAAISRKENFNEALQKVLKETISKHKKVIFNGDNYSEAWHKEAEKRGLPNIKTTLEALPGLTSKEAIELFEKYKVLSKKEMESRFNILVENYTKTVDIEGNCALDMAKTMITPAVLRYQKELSQEINLLSLAGPKSPALSPMQGKLKKISKLVSRLFYETAMLEKALDGKDSKKILEAMEKLRSVVDELEGEVDDRLWPLPKYGEMLFVY